MFRLSHYLREIDEPAPTGRSAAAARPGGDLEPDPPSI